jgi:nucleoside-diphosphate-sugar epimerase
MKRLLLTGATGFLGQAVLRELEGATTEIHATARHIPNSTANIYWHAANLLTQGEPERLIANVQPTHLLHLAWNAEPGKFWTAPANLEWAQATIALVKAFAAHGGERAVIAGTCAEYDWIHTELGEEDTPIAPATLYGQTKAATHEALRLDPATRGLPLAWGRIFFLYGPGESEKRFVADVASHLARGEPAECSPGTQERDFLHVADAARAFVLALRSDYEGAFNVASGRCVPVRDVARELGRLAGRPELVRIGARPAVPGDPPRLAAGTMILRERIGFTPKYDLASGLADTLAWWRAHGASPREPVSPALPTAPQP